MKTVHYISHFKEKFPPSMFYIYIYIYIYVQSMQCEDLIYMYIIKWLSHLFFIFMLKYTECKVFAFTFRNFSVLLSYIANLGILHRIIFCGILH